MKSWRRQKQRFILMIIGALLISGGLSTLIGLSETNKGTVINSLQKKWAASYDIVVRPKETKSITEENNLFDPNYLSGISGGISVEDYEKIKNIQDVDIAAPISMIGFTGYGVIFKSLDIKEPGIYRVTNTSTDHNGLEEGKEIEEFYFSRGIHEEPDQEVVDKYGFVGFSALSDYTRVLLAAIDPVEEARLVGLDQAMVPLEGEKNYFSESDIVSSIDLSKSPGPIKINAMETTFPVILSNRSFINQTINFKIEKLDIPYKEVSEKQKALEEIEKNGGAKYLKTFPATNTESFTYNSDEAHRVMIENFLGIDTKTGKKKPMDEELVVDYRSILGEKTGPLTYKTITSPFPDRWTNAFEVIPYKGESIVKEVSTYRKPQITEKSLLKNPRLNPIFIGFFDPGKLNILQDPENELPMETYKAPIANLVLNEKGEPLNPPRSINPTSNMYGFMLQSPSMLTTIEAAQQILGESPISAIRIKVKGVEGLGDESQDKLESVASEIERITGLKTDITLGSSPQPLLINIPKVNSDESLGWIEQPWIKIGASINIFNETKVGYTGIILCNILVAIIYVFSTSLVSFLSRKQEFAVLLAIGWKPKQLKKLLLVESLLIGAIITVITLLAQLGFSFSGNFSIIDSLLLTVFVMMIYLIGPLFPMRLINKIHPSQVMRAGEISVTAKRVFGTHGLWSIVLNSVLGRLPRNAASILAIALPTSLLILFIYVTFRLKGVLYTSWLGQYVSMEVGTQHYIAVAVSLLISILTTSEILYQNINERRNEISLLKALGWKNKHVRSMVLLEGAVIGLIGGVIGGILSLLIISFMYGPLPVSELWLPLITCLSPIIVGILGGWLPSRMAMKTEPMEGMKGISGSFPSEKSYFIG
ncbi:FtsX-like permease family protein [Neobacillus niacini]|uniref:FtsX-like permease family protein n=1 Tax=Neobacillus niacini TaxID=86668 RepID=UPI0020408B06|nr:ABC transporter permease [Neobacillus niacini]MCM3690714.1 ABC transporter permease [Neobacillus niacini]